MFTGGGGVVVDSSHRPDKRRRKFLMGVAGLGAVVAGVPLQSHAKVLGVRMSVTEQITRVVFDMDSASQYSVFVLDDPSRVVVDLQGVDLPEGMVVRPPSGAVVEHIRYAQRDSSNLRIVLDLQAPIADPHSFTLLPAQGAPHRLVLDLKPKSASFVARTPAAITSSSAPKPPRDIIVAIDAGHGGRDPGAIGSGGTREKDVVLQISRRLATKIDTEFGMRAYLVRTGDYFLPLRQRIDRARAVGADVFLSVHADAIHDRTVQGSSVYMLSERGASSEAARFLAESENRSDLQLGGVPIERQDNSLTSVLLDLAQSGSLEASYHLAQRLISELHRVGKVRKPEVERANFAVLRSPDIPSVLVEAAFISNPAEERRLRTPSFQDALSDAIIKGLRAYFSVHAPPDTLIAETPRREHVIKPGETLSHIANHYQLSVSELRSLNSISGDRIFVGQVLQIPQRGS